MITEQKRKIVIADIDQVIADGTPRFTCAKEQQEQYRALLEHQLAPALAPPRNREAVQQALENLLKNLYWQTAFDPGLVPGDQLISNAPQHLLILQAQGYEIIYLTSRPEYMRAATLQWFADHGIGINSRQLVMKPSASTHVKTTIWKASKIQEFIPLFGAEEILVVDDEQTIISEIQKHCGPRVRCELSLADAVKAKGDLP